MQNMKLSNHITIPENLQLNTEEERPEQYLKKCWLIRLELMEKGFIKSSFNPEEFALQVKDQLNDFDFRFINPEAFLSSMAIMCPAVYETDYKPTEQDIGVLKFLKAVMDCSEYINHRDNTDHVNVAMDMYQKVFLPILDLGD